MLTHLPAPELPGRRPDRGRRARRTPPIWTLLLACTALFTSACTGSEDATDGSGQRGEKVAPWGESTTLFLTAEPLGSDTYFLLRPPPTEGGGSAGAMVSGQLAVLSGGCLGLSPDTAVAWPNGTTALPEGDGVELSDGQVLRLGDRLETGGGYAGVDFTGQAADCPGSNVAFINDPGE